jgi:ribosomal protein L40E
MNMFFLGVFGIENKDKEIKILENISCKKCNSTVTGRLIKNFNFFHFFFIPIFKWDERYYVICDRCNALYSIEKEKGKAIERGEDINITYWDLQEIKQEYNSDEYFRGNICKKCGREVDTSFKYCPHCGAKL